MFNPIYGIVFTIILNLATLLNFCKKSADRDATLRALRRENTMLTRKNMALDEYNLALRKENDALVRRLNNVENTQALRDEQAAYTIEKLQAEVRLKDKMLEQKWKTARSVVNG